MKKTLCLTSIVSIFLFSGLSFAEDMKGMEGKDTQMKKGMMGKGMMGPMMMKMMSEKSVTATSDGGIVVLAMNKLTKYDKDLNVVKEVEVKIDMDVMQKQMADMMKMCPMMKDGMKGSGGTEEAVSEAATDGSDPADHAPHH